MAYALTSLELGGNEVDKVNEAVGIAPFVVVPGTDLDELTVNAGQTSVKDGRVSVALDVGGNVGIFGVTEDALELAFSGLLHSGVDFVNGNLAAENSGEVGDGAGGPVSYTHLTLPTTPYV